ncbi:MAG: ABC transporter permease [Terriglobales bacterium]
MRGDLGYALRQMRRAPGFAIAAIVILALGIGANTAIFSVIDAVMLKPLPLLRPGQLVVIENGPGFPLSGPNFLDMQRENHAFQGMALYTSGEDFNLTGAGRPDHVTAMAAEANFFSVLGATPMLGRTFLPGEDRAGRDQVAVLSYGLWVSRFGAESSVVGRDIELNGRKYLVAGVMPPSFHFPVQAQLWVPKDMSPAKLPCRGCHRYMAVGRLKAGLTPRAGLADLQLIAKRLQKEYPNADNGVKAWLMPLHQWVERGAGSSLILMLWAVALVLLIACVNVANLLLARAAGRQKEMAVRAALGAGRGRLIQQLLTESVLLALIGGAIGVGLAEIGVRAMAAMKGAVVPQPNPIRIDPMVLLFTLGVAVVVGTLFGLAPAWQLSSTDANDELKGGAGATVSAGRRRRWLSDALVVAEMAISMALLVAAGLLLRSFIAQQNINLGARRKGVLTAWVNLPAASYAGQTQQFDLAHAWLARVRALPAVESAAITDRLPLYGGDNGIITLYGQPANHNDADSNGWVEVHGVTPGYFRAFAIPLLRGRRLTEADVSRSLALDNEMTRLLGANPSQLPKPGSAAARAMEAAVYPVDINQTMARKFWPHQNPLGKRFSYIGEAGMWLRVVGVVGDTRQWGIQTPPRPEEFQAWDGSPGFCLVLHTGLPPLALEGPVRRALAGLDARLPLYQVRTMNQLVAEQTGQASFLSLMVGLFAGLAVVLAGVGIYGVMSYLVAQRRREVGIRLALGADRDHVLGLVLGRGLRLAAAGIVIGGIGAVSAGKLLAAFLYGVKDGNPATLGAAAVFLFLIALLACYWPARRAAGLDPAVALREE